METYFSSREKFRNEINLATLLRDKFGNGGRLLLLPSIKDGADDKLNFHWTSARLKSGENDASWEQLLLLLLPKGPCWELYWPDRGQSTAGGSIWLCIKDVSGLLKLQTPRAF